VLKLVLKSCRLVADNFTKDACYLFRRFSLELVLEPLLLEINDSGADSLEAARNEVWINIKNPVPFDGKLGHYCAHQPKADRVDIRNPG
jgi:hypothetical protein